MTVALREPKRKHWGNVAEVVPFPIHTEKATGVPVCDATWQTYTGRFNGDSVIVEKLEDIWALYTMGCFGKGSLSRGCSILGRARRNHPQFIKESQWRRHKQWKESSSLKETESVPKSPEKHKQDASNNSNCDKKKDDRKSRDESQKGTSSKEMDVTTLDDAGSEGSDIVEVENRGEGKRKLDSEGSHQPFKRRNTAAEVLKVRNPAAKDLMARNPAGEEETRNSATREATARNTAGEEPKLRHPAAEESKTPNSRTEEPNSSAKQGPADQSNIEVVDLLSDEESLCSEEAECRNSTAVGISEPGCSSSAGNFRGSEETEVVVLAGVDSEDEDYLSKLKPRLEHEPGYLSQEKLVLSLEEALYLSYGLGCLRILGFSGDELGLVEIWKLFQESQRSFVQRYVAYHYFRSKGWVVKSGLKYGGDFALYKEGPQRYHSSYVVIVQVIKEGTGSRDPARDRRPISWTQLMGLNRLLEATGKEVLLCQVIWPDDLQGKVLPNPEVISSFRVQETLLRRWVARQDREGTEHQKNHEGSSDPQNSAESVCA